MKYLYLFLFVALQSTLPPTRHVAKEIPSHCLMPQHSVVMLAEELPAPGNPGHVQPSAGEHCVHAANDPAHNCNCHRECRQNTDDNGNPIAGARVVEDPKCRVYCFKDHCHCPVENCE